MLCRNTLNIQTWKRFSRSIGSATPRNPVNVDRVRDKCFEIFLLIGFFSTDDARLNGERERSIHWLRKVTMLELVKLPMY